LLLQPASGFASGEGALRELALFAGAGGGLLASRLLGWRTVCAVELEEYPRRVLQQRQLDGCLDPFPIWDDVRTFDGRPWRGAVDIISGGFPCQAFSTAARGRNNAADLWPEMLRIVSEVQPRHVFAENVQPRPIIRACEQLRELGYRCGYTKLSAADLGSAHQRERYWLVANANQSGEPRCPIYVEARRGETPSAVEWWHDDADALGVSDGMAFRLERMQALGNGQVPAVAALAWRLLSGVLNAAR
jgi:DNA (cytosine-5)-methyltransferase 1